MFGTAITVLAVVALGISAGAVLAEGVILIPFWRSLEPTAFLAWYHQHARVLVWFFGPLEAASALLVVLAALVSWLTGESSPGLLAGASVLAVLVLAAFPVYFQRVNASFVEATIAPTEVPVELRRYSTYHWLRVALAVGAFALASVAAANHHARTA